MLQPSDSIVSGLIVKAGGMELRNTTYSQGRQEAEGEGREGGKKRGRGRKAGDKPYPEHGTYPLTFKEAPPPTFPSPLHGPFSPESVGGLTLLG